MYVYITYNDEIAVHIYFAHIGDFQNDVEMQRLNLKQRSDNR